MCVFCHTALWSYWDSNPALFPAEEPCLTKGHLSPIEQTVFCLLDLLSCLTAIFVTVVVEVRGVEPRASACKAEVLPLHHTPKYGSEGGLRTPNTLPGLLVQSQAAMPICPPRKDGYSLSLTSAVRITSVAVSAIAAHEIAMSTISKPPCAMKIVDSVPNPMLPQNR